MNYFVTGGTGFIGRFLVPRLLDRGGTVVMATLGYDPAMPAEIRRLVSHMDEPEPAGVTASARAPTISLTIPA